MHRYGGNAWGPNITGNCENDFCSVSVWASLLYHNFPLVRVNRVHLHWFQTLVWMAKYNLLPCHYVYIGSGSNFTRRKLDVLSCFGIMHQKRWNNLTQAISPVFSIHCSGSVRYWFLLLSSASVRLEWSTFQLLAAISPVTVSGLSPTGHDRSVLVLLPIHSHPDHL